jgi:hypothetical protein
MLISCCLIEADSEEEEQEEIEQGEFKGVDKGDSKSHDLPSLNASNLNSKAYSEKIDAIWNEMKQTTTPLISEERPSSIDHKKPFPQNKLESLVKSIGKKTKLTVLQKSQLHWQRYVESDSNLETDLKQHGKNGYLERRRFLDTSERKLFSDNRNG